MWKIKYLYCDELSNRKYGIYIKYNCIYYLHNSDKHRLDGPALINRYLDDMNYSIINRSNLETEQWYVRNKLHRINGHALIRYYKYGSYLNCVYKNGHLIETDDDRSSD